MSEIKNMTEGNVTGTILRFFFPALFSNVLQQIYTIADTAVVGRGIGDTAVAAVGNTAAVSLLITGFLQGLTNGFSVITAQYYGSGNYTRLKSSIAVSAKLCAAVSIPLSVLCTFFLRNIFALMKTDTLISDESLTYGTIIFGGLIITSAYNLLSCVLRALGDSKTPFAAILVSSAVNLILDFIFIYVFKTGVGGTAAATLFSQTISVLICFIKLKKTGFISFKTAGFPKSTEVYFRLLRNGLPMAFMNSLTAVGCVIVQSFINTLGADSTSAYSVCTRYLNLFMLPAVTAGFTVSVFAGQNRGAEKYSRIRGGVRTGIVIAVISYVPACLIMLTCSRALAHFMLSGDTAVFYACSYMKILGFSLILLNIIFIFRSAVQGMGYPVIPMISGITEMVLRISAITIMLPETGFSAAAYADVIAWAGALILNAAAYFSHMKYE